MPKKPWWMAFAKVCPKVGFRPRERSFISWLRCELRWVLVQIQISLALRSIVGFCLDGLIMIHDEIEYHLASVTKMV